MSFISFQFILFFVIIYIANICFICIAKDISESKYKTILLVESICFVIISDWKTAICLAILVIVCHLAIKWMDKYSDNISVRKWILTGSLIITVGQLVFFKYNWFSLDTIYVPIGISFFSFSAIAYLIDVYRKKYEAYNNVVDLATYLFFFPKLVSGPIIRPDKFINQLYQGKKLLNLNNLQIGIQMVVCGMFKKMVLADHLAVFVDDVFAAPIAFDSVTCIWAMLSYSFQIYFDFSGYSDMAIGFSKMLGIDIENNFNLPYISKNVTEFWKRWHISLSSWLQDYMYISLGGNRKGRIRTQINLMLTMLIGGLWHGSSGTFIIWGGIHGIALVIQKKFHRKCGEFIKDNKVMSIVSTIMTFVFATFAWVFFRADGITNALEVLGQACGNHNGITQIYFWTWFAIGFAVCEIVFAKLHQKDKNYISVEYPILELNTIKSLIVFFVMIGLTIILAYVGETAFIYGQF